MKFSMYLTGAGYIEIDPMWAHIPEDPYFQNEMFTYIPDETFIKFLELTDGTEVIDGRSVHGPLPGNTFIPFVDKACTHEMKEYVGLTSRYNFCTKCDHKEE